LLTCLERRSLLRRRERRNGDEWGGGRRKIGSNRPSGELVSTMLTLVWAISGICKGISGAEEERVDTYGIAYVERHVEDE
jgi:hypothetical protein